MKKCTYSPTRMPKEKLLHALGPPQGCLSRSLPLSLPGLGFRAGSLSFTRAMSKRVAPVIYLSLSLSLSLSLCMKAFEGLQVNTRHDPRTCRV